MPQPVHYLPIATTLASAIFFTILLRRYLSRRSGTHLLWWAAGIFAYGLGTFLEATITLQGNSILLNKLWYVAGALLGGYPLAQGTVFLLLSRRTARILTALTLPVIVAVSILVMLSPVNLSAMEPHRPSGAILGWQWVRLMTPFINLYAVAFLVGGALLSAVRYSRKTGVGDGKRAVGNGLIAFGALLPGIGGGMAKAGIVEALYVGEFVGLFFIWAGYQACVTAPTGANVSRKESVPAGVPLAQRPKAFAKKSFSTVSWPIFACSSFNSASWNPSTGSPFLANSSGSLS